MSSLVPEARWRDDGNISVFWGMNALRLGDLATSSEPGRFCAEGDWRRDQAQLRNGRRRGTPLVARVHLGLEWINQVVPYSFFS
jgi:hypothetical protein